MLDKAMGPRGRFAWSLCPAVGRGFATEEQCTLSISTASRQTAPSGRFPARECMQRIYVKGEIMQFRQPSSHLQA